MAELLESVARPRTRRLLFLAVAAVSMMLAGSGAAVASSESAGDIDEVVFAVQSLGSSITGLGFGHDSPLASVEIRVPAGYTIDLARPIGSEIGILGGALTEAMGEPASSTFVFETLVVADPAAYAGSAASCASGAHAAIWIAKPAVLGATMDLPVFVDAAVGQAGTAYTLRFCPLWPASPTYPSGVQLRNAYLILDRALSSPSAAGAYTWSAIVSPATESLAADPSRAFELRAVVPWPQVLVLAARFDAPKNQAVVTGRVTAQGRPRAGAVVELAALRDNGFSDLGSVRTDAKGQFAVRRTVDARTSRISAEVEADIGPCTEPSVAPGGCLSQTTSPPPGATARLSIPRKTDAKRAFRARDQALARRSVVTAADLPSDWLMEGSGDFPEACEEHPADLSALTLTGESVSPVFASALGAVASVADVYVTTAQARSAYAAESTLAAASCLADSLGSPDVIVRSVGPLRFPAFGEATRAFRIRLAVEGERYVIDLVAVRVGRVVMRHTFVTIGGHLSLERAVVGKVAGRAARG